MTDIKKQRVSLKDMTEEEKKERKKIQQREYTVWRNEEKKIQSFSKNKKNFLVVEWRKKD